VNHEFIADPGVADRRLDVFLATVTGLSRSQFQRAIKASAVSVNGQPARASYMVQPGDRVVVDLPKPPPRQVQPPTLDIIYEDANIVVVDKPAGLAVHPGSGHINEATVADYARTVTTDPDPERPGIVHRLDRDTSGLLVLAKSAEAKLQLQTQWRTRTVEKRYLLLAVGRVRPAKAVIKLPLDRDPARPLQRAVVTGGKPATTRYDTLLELPGYSYLEAQPETGRTHQLRVHMAAIGHAIAGDTLYGPPERPLGLKRQFLHATSLKFTSPAGVKVELTSELPPDLKLVLDQLTAGL
jgi:23S rRNA pseudouridine1911/1915/1917 synthase